MPAYRSLILTHRMKNAMCSMAIILMTFLVSCSSERGVSVIPGPQLLFVAVSVPRTIAIDVFDCDADTLVTRIPDAGSAGSNVLSVSTDGKYLAVLDIVDLLSLFDVETLTKVVASPTHAEFMTFTFAPNRLVCSRPESTFVYEYPAMTLDTVWERGFELFVDSPLPGELVGVVRAPDSVLHQFSDVLVRLDVASGSVVDSFRFVSPGTGRGVIALEAVMSSNKNTLYILGYDESGPAVFAFDIASHASVYRQSLLTLAWSLAVTPDAREVWVTQSAIDDPPPNLGYILVLEAATGTPKDTIRTSDVRLDKPGSPLSIRRIVFHPTLPKAFVDSYATVPAVLEISATSRSIDGALYESKPTLVFDIAMGKPQ